MYRFWYIVVVFLLLLSFGYNVFSVTSTNKNITIRVTGTWDPFGMGWEPDELLISPTNVLNKPYGAIVDQNDLTNNGGRMLTYFGIDYTNTCEPTNDSVYPTTSLTRGEASELWLTWDTNALYVAVRGHSAGRYNNLMIYFDREPGVGKTTFDQSDVVWRRRVLFFNFDPDMYIGFWCEDNKPDFAYAPGKGGVQLHSHASSTKVYISSYNDSTAGTVSNMSTNVFDFWYNGSSEPDMDKRVAIARIAWSFFFTNVNPTNMWLKVAVATTGVDSGAFNYDYMPDSSVEVRSSEDTSEDNFIMVRVTDGDAKPIINVSVRDEAYINFYPGVKLKPSATARFSMVVVRDQLMGSEDDKPKVFAPSKGDKLKVKIPINLVTDSITKGSVKIYDMKGNVVRNLVSYFDFDPVTGSLGDKNSVISAGKVVVSDPNAYEYPYTFVWDGTDDRGQKVPIGNYVIVIKGVNISGSKVSGTRLISVIY